jgi:hypothetical protein
MPWKRRSAMSSFLTRTTSFAYLEFAAAQLQARGHAAEIVPSRAAGPLLRVDGDRSEADLRDLLKISTPLGFSRGARDDDSFVVP